MNIIANHKGIILAAEDNGSYIVEDNDLNEWVFDNVLDAANRWNALLFKEMYA